MDANTLFVVPIFIHVYIYLPFSFSLLFAVCDCVPFELFIYNGPNTITKLLSVFRLVY